MPEEMRKEHETLFSIGNGSYIYHAKKSEEIVPKMKDFKDWLEGLADGIRKEMEERGFEKCKGMIPFTRHVMERNDIGMEAWMRQNLNKEEFAY